MATLRDVLLLGGEPILVNGFRCPTCGPTRVVCDDYDVDRFEMEVCCLSGVCETCRGRVSFCTRVPQRAIEIVPGLRVPGDDEFLPKPGEPCPDELWYKDVKPPPPLLRDTGDDDDEPDIPE